MKQKFNTKTILNNTFTILYVKITTIFVHLAIILKHLVHCNKMMYIVRRFLCWRLHSMKLTIQYFNTKPFVQTLVFVVN